MIPSAPSSGLAGGKHRLSSALPLPMTTAGKDPPAILVQLATVARKDDAGSGSLRAMPESGATAANGATRALGTSYALYDDRFEVDPRPGWRGPNLVLMRCRRRGGSGMTVGRLSQAPRRRYCRVPAAAPGQQAVEILLRATP